MIATSGSARQQRTAPRPRAGRAIQPSKRAVSPPPATPTPGLSGREAYLWSLYQADRSITNRNALVEFYMPIVRYAAKRLQRHLCPIDIDELVSDGALGLIWAVEHFDPARGLRFCTYAHHRISGAILDGVRNRDPIPRSARSRVKLLANAEAACQRRRGRPATDKELARALRIPLEQVAVWKRDALLADTKEISLSLEASKSYFHWRNDKPTSLGETLEDELAVPPSVRLDTSDWWDELSSGLNTSELVILLLYWRYDWTMKRIGQHMGLSESRVSQAHSAVKSFLKQSKSVVDFADITTRGTGMRCLRWVFAHCHSLRHSGNAKARQRRREKAT